MPDSSLTRLRRRLHRDPREGWIAGVCAGLARALGTDPALVRAGFVLAGLFLTKITIGVYLVAWILLDER